MTKSEVRCSVCGRHGHVVDDPDCMPALGRAERKGYMPAAMAGEWEAFQYLTKERAEQDAARASDARKGEAE